MAAISADNAAVSHDYHMLIENQSMDLNASQSGQHLLSTATQTSSYYNMPPTTHTQVAVHPLDNIQLEMFQLVAGMGYALRLLNWLLENGKTQLWNSLQDDLQQGIQLIKECSVSHPMHLLLPRLFISVQAQIPSLMHVDELAAISQDDPTIKMNKWYNPWIKTPDIQPGPDHWWMTLETT